MKYYLIFVVACLLLNVPSQTIAQTPVLSEEESQWLKNAAPLRFTGDPSWLPFEAFNEQGEHQGIVADYLSLIEDKIEYRFEKIPVTTWTQAKALSRDGRVDILSETDGSSLKADMLFTQTYFSNPVVMVMDSKQHYVEDFNQLRGKRVAIMSPYGYVKKIRSTYPEHNYLEVSNLQEGLLAVSSGRVDVLLCSVTLCSYNIAQLGLNDVKIVGKTSLSTGLVFAVNRQHPELVTILNKAINNISPDQHQQILEHWSLSGYVEKRDYRIALIILGASIIIVSVFIVRQRQLNQYARRLSSSEARYARAVRGTQDGIWEWHLAKGRTYYSPRWKALLGYAEEELQDTPDTFNSRVHPDDQELVKQAFTIHLGQKGKFDVEMRLLTASGNYRWFRAVGQAEFNAKGNAFRMAGALSDIHDDKLLRAMGKSRNRILEMTAKGAGLNAILDALIESIESENPSLICSILLLDEERKRLIHGAARQLPEFYLKAVDGIEIGRGRGSCGTAAYLGEAVIVSDIQSHEYWENFKEIAAEAGLHACWSQPIFDSANHVIGTFAIYLKSVSTPAEHELKMIEQAATLAGIAIEKNLTNEQLQLASLVYQNSSDAMMVFNDQRMIIAVNPAFTEITGYSANEVIGHSADILNSEFYGRDFYREMSRSVRKTGRWQGEVKSRHKNGEIYYRWLKINTIFHDDGSVYRRVSLFSDISERKKSEQIIWQQANYDALTKLPNRVMLNDRLQQQQKFAKRSDSQFALLLIDLDRFKEINDTLGHSVGDILLIEAASRIQKSVRESDTVARLGGDEFCVILADLSDNSHVENIADKILCALSQPFQLGDEQAYVSASIGITLYPDDTQDIDALLKNADQAMYEAKKQGRNRYHYFTPSMQQVARRRMRLINDLRDALEQEQFFLVYQPIVDLQSRRVCKAEALIRWQHPHEGLINPAQFIEIAEETGMIVELGDWVLSQAVAQASEWRRQIDPGFQISVNTSPVQYQAHGYDREAWLKHLKHHQLEGDGIVMEITEGLMMDANHQVTEQLIGFRNAGIQVALDDFGTGYSSLAYLKRLDIDFIKIDRAFVQNLENDADDRALCEAIVVMAHKLNLKVIAEGVETESASEILTRMGCDYAQGYLYSKPVVASEFEANLTATIA